MTAADTTPTASPTTTTAAAAAAAAAAATDVAAADAAASRLPPSPAPAGDRIGGYDVARALAILGMVLVHFAMAMSWERWETDRLAPVVDFLDGRAAATFFVLAGVGVALRWRAAIRRAGDGGPDAAAASRARAAERRTLVRRGLFLIAAGFVNLAIWSGDILRVYGVTILLLVWFLDARGWWLWAAAAAFALAFVALMTVIDYEYHWDWETMTYRGLWTPAGLARNVFFDGFRSVAPWAGLMFYGVWLGRRDLRAAATRRRVLATAAAVFVAAEAASRATRWWLRSRPDLLDAESAVFLFGTESMPPLPLFLLSATGFSTLVIALCVVAAERFASSALTRALAATGQLALTWYIAHVVLGLGPVVGVGWGPNVPMATSLATGTAFFALAMAASVLWKRRWRLGPLEWVMRRVAG